MIYTISQISNNGATPRRYQANQTNASADKLYPCSVCHKWVIALTSFSILKSSFYIFFKIFYRVFDKVKSRSAHMKTHKSAATANGQDGSSMPGNKNRKNNHLHHKSPLAGALTPASPLSSTSHSSLSSTSCSLPSPFLPSQSLFWSRLVLDAEPDQKNKTTSTSTIYQNQLPYIEAQNYTLSIVSDHNSAWINFTHKSSATTTMRRAVPFSVRVQPSHTHKQLYYSDVYPCWFGFHHSLIQRDPVGKENKSFPLFYI